MLTPDDLETILEGEAPPERPTAVDPDGYVFDTETGEVLGRVDVSTAFVVDSLDGAEWVLEMRSRIEGDIAGLVARKAALVEQLDRLIGVQRRRLSWWSFRFQPSLIGWAKTQLAKGSKTWRCPWGSVSWRATKGTTAILDDAAALKFVEAWKPEAVKVVKSVNVTACRAAAEAFRRACDGEQPEMPWLKTSGAGESVTVSTGIEVQEKS